MNIKIKIGNRIREERKNKNLTRKELADLTDDFNISRINNYERGERTPGPEEIKQLAKALEVSPAYLMCFTDERQAVKPSNLFVPLLDYKQARDPITHIDKVQKEDEQSVIPLSSVFSKRVSKYTFALKVTDDSMFPEIRVKDILIVDTALSPNPGDYVVVKVETNPDIIICQFKKLSYTSPDFEFLTLNDNWPNITVNESNYVKIIGKVVQNIREYS